MKPRLMLEELWVARFASDLGDSDSRVCRQSLVGSTSSSRDVDIDGVMTASTPLLAVGIVHHESE